MEKGIEMTDEKRCEPPQGKLNYVVHIPDDAAGIQWRGIRYRLSAITPPRTVALLVAALEDISVLSDQSAVLDLAWNALARAKETGIDMADEKRSEPWLEDDTDGAPAEIVLAALTRCFLSWRPDARVLGNVRAGDAFRAIREMWGKANAHTTPPATVAALVVALDDLLADTQHATHDCGDDDCPVRRAHAALALYREAGR